MARTASLRAATEILVPGRGKARREEAAKSGAPRSSGSRLEDLGIGAGVGREVGVVGVEGRVAKGSQATSTDEDGALYEVVMTLVGGGVEVLVRLVAAVWWLEIVIVVVGLGPPTGPNRSAKKEALSKSNPRALCVTSHSPPKRWRMESSPFPQRKQGSRGAAARAAGSGMEKKRVRLRVGSALARTSK